MKKSEMILKEIGETDEKYLITKAPRKKGFIAVIAAAAVLAVLLIAMPVISKTSSPSILPPEPAATAAQGEKSSSADKETEPQPETDAAGTDRTGFDYTPGVILPPMGGYGITEDSWSGIDQYGYPIRYEKYYENWFEGQNEDSDTKTAAGAFCLVKVNGVKTVDATAKMHELDPTLNPEFTYYETTAEIKIEKVMRATDNVAKSIIKEGEIIDADVLFQFVYDGDGKLINGGINICFPVIEIGSEYIVYIVNSFGETKSSLMLVITVPINDAVIDEDYLKYYADNYPIGENAYKLNIKYLNEFLYDYLSDPRMPERFEDPIFEIDYSID